MSHTKGYKILAGDINNFLGGFNSSTSYSSSAAANQKVAALYGVGYGDRGYGQTTYALSPIASGQPIHASTFSDMRSAILVMANYQGTATTLLPPASDFTSGSKAKAENPLTTSYDLATMIANIDANRFNTNGGASLSLTANALTVTRATNWGSGSAVAIIAEATATFPSENAARYFFNSGGALTLVLSNPNTSSVQNLNWNTILANLGTITISANGCARSGSGGTVNSGLGYYGLTGTYQTILDGTNIGSGAYSANDVFIQALVSSVTGTNGGNGSVIKIKITLTDQHTNIYNVDTVNSGTNAVFGYKKAATGLTGISSPTFATVTNF